MTNAEIEALVEAGKRAWERGDPLPPYPPDGTPVASCVALHWLGYIAARGVDFFRRRDMALYPDSIDPRP